MRIINLKGGMLNLKAKVFEPKSQPTPPPPAVAVNPKIPYHRKPPAPPPPSGTQGLSYDTASNDFANEIEKQRAKQRPKIWTIHNLPYGTEKPKTFKDPNGRIIGR